MDISSLYSIGSPAVRQAAENSPIERKYWKNQICLLIVFSKSSREYKYH